MAERRTAAAAACLLLAWRELEPEEGVYAWEAIQQTCHLDALRQQGVHLVLRILCDEPGAEAHLDIPDWLYEKTVNGSWYDLSYGKGYSPDCADPAFFAAHAALLPIMLLEVAMLGSVGSVPTTAGS